jgi:hypothetical protein
MSPLLSVSALSPSLPDDLFGFPCLLASESEVGGSVSESTGLGRLVTPGLVGWASEVAFESVAWWITSPVGERSFRYLSFSLLSLAAAVKIPIVVEFG